jgi:RNA polymerase-interacting CarD/CdnL/TRCF family regulator
MAKNYKVRRKKISEMIMAGSLRSDLRLIRDLTALKLEKGLNESEKDSLFRVKTRFIKEWALCKKMDFEPVAQEFNKLLTTMISVPEKA